ncbi:MAG: hypothetical protein K2N01_03300 [Lachnospiraceae bacterium]|nr:hypothetical protein [Lachnospiraceae bacterium]
MSKRWKRILAVIMSAVFVFSCMDISERQSDNGTLPVSAAEQEEDGQTDDGDTYLADMSDTEQENTEQESSTEDVFSTDEELSTEQEPSSEEAGGDGDSAVPSDAQQTDVPDDNNVITPVDEGNAAGEEEETEESNEDSGISTYALANPAASVNIPQNIADVVRGQIYYVRTYDDVLALQELSYQDSLEGCIFEFARLENQYNVWNLTDIGFTGLGNVTYPFKGRLQEDIDNGVTFTVSRPMFNYLGEGASLKNFAFNLNNATSGIADYFVVTSVTEGGVTYEHVTLNGTVRNNNGPAGALYGTVINEGGQLYELPVDGAGLSLTGVTSVTGQIAGGYIGDTQGKVCLRVTDGTNVAASVISSATAAGGLVGRLSEGASLLITDVEVAVNNAVSGTGSVGGIVGVCENAAITSNVNVRRGGSARIQGTVNAGGFVGLIVNSTTDISQFIQACNVGASNSTSYAGGIVGQYQADSADASLRISQVGVYPATIGAGTSSSAYSGGIIGYINGGNAVIADIAYDDSVYQFSPQLRYAYNASSTASSSTGGIAGMVKGDNITISNVKVNFTSSYGLAGYRVGDVLGYVDTATKVKLTDITVASSYIPSNTPTYCGGIAGYVNKGSIIALCGTIDLSGIGYTNSRSGLYGSTKGYVAGGQTESIIYLEEGAVYKKNATAANPESSTWMTTDYCNYDYGYTLDDVGSYGGVYRNVRDAAGPVIRFDAPYGSEVSGALTVTGGKYRIAGDADALRLALALNTFDAAATGHPLRFGTGCFVAGATADTLLAADYEVTGDLDFERTGIFSLSRNDSLDYIFTGSFAGVTKADGKAPSIRLYTVSKQYYGGLFPRVQNATLRNLSLEGKLYYLKNAGGFAAYSEGDLTVDDVSTAVVMHTSAYVSSSVTYYYGGLTGQHTMAGGTLSITDTTIAPEITNVHIQQMVGGAIGRIVTGQTEVSAPDITVQNVTIGSRISAAARFTYNYSYNSHARMAGLFADIGHDYETNQTSNESVGGTITDKTYAMLRLTDLTVDKAAIDASAINSNTSYVRAMGGLLGYSWRNVEVDLTRNQKNAAIRVTGSSIQSYGRVGGLVTTLGGRLNIQDKAALDSLTMTARSTQTFSAFLVADARKAFITLKAADYTLGSSSASGYGSDFDEIAGINMEIRSDISGYGINYSGTPLSGNCMNSAGIVNILMPEFKDMTASGYRSYRNQVMSGTNNRYTRYHYNLFTDDYGYAYSSNHVGVSGNAAVINSPEKLMLASLARATSSSLKRFLLPYFNNTDYGNLTNWNLSGRLDMNGYSYYPTQVTGGTYKGDGSAVLVLYGEDIENRETSSNKQPSNTVRQHYRMHAALFCDSSGLTVEKLTLQGTAASIGDYSGALIAGRTSWINVNGATTVSTVTIKDITCDGIRLSNYKDERSQGLLVGYVTNGTKLYMNGISTTAKYDTNSGLAASALIAQVGNSGADNVRVYFKNMKVEDEPNKVFKYASFIYYYDYVDNIDINRSFGLYLFSKADDTNGNVTYGDELKLGVNYSDEPRDTHLEDIISNAQNGKYIPYVYTVKQIFVNPRNGNLDRGCGTYEDPYIIDSPRQLLSLYCYLTGSSAYDALFKVEMEGDADTGTLDLRWQVNRIAGGNGLGGRCTNTPHTAIKYGEVNFPTRDELRQAYYLITDDVDLAAVTDLNDVVINNDFAGLGTTSCPFAGVIVGRKTDGSRPTVTLPNTRTGRSQAYYGLIQYMQGAVVKDLIIRDMEHAHPDQTGEINVTSTGGGVAAVSLGGDNIIDHVAVEMTLHIGTNTKTGGYVGEVCRGTVLVRNVSADDLADYSVVINGTTLNGTTWHNNLNTYKNKCRMIGWVQDGAVLYENTNADFAPGKSTLEAGDFGLESADTGIPLSYSFPLVNEDHLNQGNGSGDNNGKIKVTGTTAGGFTLTIHDSEQLEVAALALNAGAFSIYDSGTASVADATGVAPHYNGYDHTAICRKAAYSNLGSNSGADFTLATGSDDCNGHYPYFYYRYMDFSAVSGGYGATQVTSGNKRLSVLNWSNGHATVYGGVSIGNAVTNYELTAGGTYDLTSYGRSFRGFGALYDYLGTSYVDCPYSMFRANFNGRGATVTFAMDRDWDNITTVGMFNNLTTGRPAGFTIQNMRLENCSVHNEYTVNTSSGASAGGLLAGYVKGVWTFADITAVGEADSVYDAATGEVRKKTGAANDTAEATLAVYKPTVHINNVAGGLVGQVKYVGYSSYSSMSQSYLDEQQVTFRNCGMQNVYITGKHRIGGLVGEFEGYSGDNNTCFGTVAFTGCSIQSSTVWSADNAIAGGFVGSVGWCHNTALTSPGSWGKSYGSFSIANATVSDVSVQTRSSGSSEYSAGGLVGGLKNWNNQTYTLPTSISDVTVDGLTAIVSPAGSSSDFYGVGGVAGGMWGYAHQFADITVTNSWIGYNKTVPLQSTVQRFPAGGLVGALTAPSSGDTSASGTLRNISVADSHVGSYNYYAGGMIGACNQKNVTITADAGKTNRIQNVDVISQTYSAGGVIGANSLGSTSGSTTWSLGRIAVENSRIQSPGQNYSDYAAAGGIVGAFRVYRSSVAMEDITVGSGSSIEGSMSGGLVGYIIDSSYTVQTLNLSGDILIGCSKDAGGTISQDSAAMRIYGLRSAGGLYGTNAARGTESSTADVQIQKTKIGAYRTDTNAAMAGGIAGERRVYGSNNTSAVLYDHTNVKDCIIVANNANTNNVAIRAGGLYGDLNDATGGASYTARVCFYNPKLSNNSIGYAPALNSPVALMTVGMTPKDVKLLGGTASSTAVHWSDLAALSATNVGTYSLRIGNFLGTSTSTNKQLYVLRPELTYDVGFAGSRPVIDVGNDAVKPTAASTTPYGYEYPYEYRKNCHIVYFEPDTTDVWSDNAADYLDSTLITGANNENEYLFASLDSVITKYNKGTNLGATFLNTYKLNQKLQNYYDISAMKVTTKNIPVIYADGGNVQDLLYSIAGILTNVGGISDEPSDAKMTGLLTVSAVRAKLKADGTIVSETGTPSLNVTNNTIKYREHVFDEIDETDGSYSISLVKFRYGWTCADGMARYETVYIPVFVVERITFFNSMSVMEGEQYSDARAHDPSVSYTEEVIVAHDSIYTLFVEMAYSDVRKKAAYQNYTVAKKLVFEQATGTDASGNYIWGQSRIPKGMRLTLVDARTGEAFYYTEEANDTWELDFTAFKDAAGNPYQLKKLGTLPDAGSYTKGDVTLEDAGLEQFYIYVDPLNVDEMTQDVFKISASITDTSRECMDVLDRTENNEVQIMWIRGLSITLGEEGVIKGVPGGTYVTGYISTDDDRHTVEIDGQIQIAASRTYWDEKNEPTHKFIDSENNNKYLDVAIYLLDERGDYVNLPQGTNIILKGGNPQVAVDQNVIYSYKDWGIRFPISLLTDNIDEKVALSDEVNNYFHITLDFSLANVDDYVGKNFSIRMELCRTADPDYPRGDKALDSYERMVAGVGDKEMAVALEVEDLLDLGINTYQQAQTRYEIPFDTKLDFNNAIVNSEDRELCADRYYLVTYRLKKKVKSADGYQYVTVKDSRGGNNPSGLHLGEELKLLIEDSQSADGYSEMVRKTFAGDSVYQVVKKFTASEIEEGIDGLSDTVGWDMKLLVDTGDIADVDLSNYKVEVTVLPYEADAGVPSSDDSATLVDYYIFTIGKIKTDM